MAVTGRPYRTREMDAGQLLRNRRRKQIYEYLLGCDDDGAHFAELRRAIRAGNGEMNYHLTVLENSGIIFSIKEDGFRMFYLVSELPQYLMEDGPAE